MILKPIDQLEIAGGARYTHETKASTLFNIAEHGRASFPYGKGFTDHQTFNNVSPEVTVAYHYSPRSEEHTSELQSLMRISYAVFCLKKKNKIIKKNKYTQ